MAPFYYPSMQIVVEAEQRRVCRFAVLRIIFVIVFALRHLQTYLTKNSLKMYLVLDVTTHICTVHS